MRLSPRVGAERGVVGRTGQQAIERYIRPDHELLCVLQLFRRSNKIIYKYAIEEGKKVFETEVRGKPFTMYDDTVIAFGAKGEELFRTNVEEPFYKRPPQHLNWI